MYLFQTFRWYKQSFVNRFSSVIFSTELAHKTVLISVAICAYQLYSFFHIRIFLARFLQTSTSDQGPHKC